MSDIAVGYDEWCLSEWIMSDVSVTTDKKDDDKSVLNSYWR